jgi:dihydroneopterin aldolase
MRSGSPPSGIDILYLHDLKADCIIGIWDWERQTRQQILLNLDIETDIRQAAAHDNIEYALDYQKLAQRVVDFVATSTFFLVETLIDQVDQLVLREYSPSRLSVQLTKPGALAGIARVGFVIERRYSQES